MSASNDRRTWATGTFIVARGFAELADAVRREGYIGLSYGPPALARPCSSLAIGNYP